MFSRSKRELDYYHQKRNIEVSSQVSDSRKTYDLRKLKNSKEIADILEIYGKILASQTKGNFNSYATKL